MGSSSSSCSTPGGKAVCFGEARATRLGSGTALATNSHKSSGNGRDNALPPAIECTERSASDAEGKEGGVIHKSMRESRTCGCIYKHVINAGLIQA